MKPTIHTFKHWACGTAIARVTTLWLAGALLALALTSCANFSTDLSASDAVNVERLDSPDARIGTVFVGDNDGLLLVRGRLEKRHFGRSPIPGHLHIEVIGKDGSMLAEQVTRYYRQSGKSSVSRFSKELAVQPGNVRTVRVIHHDRDDKEDSGSASPVPDASRGLHEPIQPV